MTTTRVEALGIERLHPNPWNPNTMSAEEFAELVAEIRHLGRLPKPVVVRPNADGYQIVDGEHGWRAAQEAGLVEIQCEVIEADDFEAMRQTYKRNQHGRHDKVREGRMFKSMLEMRGVSQRELAKQLDLSEGTIRNAFEYARAVEVRNGYADDEIAKLGVRQVRYLNLLPPIVGEIWLDMGADVAALFIDADSGAYAEKHDEAHEDARDWMQREYGFWEESGFLELAKKRRGRWSSFGSMMKYLRACLAVQRKWSYAGIKPKELLGYTRHHFEGNYYVREEFMLAGALRLLIDTKTKPPIFHLSADEFDALLREQASVGGSNSEFQMRLEAEIWKKTGTRPVRGKGSLELELLELELRDAPEWIRTSALSPQTKYAIWKYECDEDVKRDAAAGKLGSVGVMEMLPRIDAEKKRRRASEAVARATKEDLLLAVVKCVNDRLRLRDLPQAPEEVNARFDRFAKLDKVDLVAVRDALEGTNNLELIATYLRGTRQGRGIQT